MKKFNAVQPDVLIYIGAGDLAEDASLVATANRHSYLIEADSEQASELTQVFAGNQKVTVLALAIAEKAEKRDFHHQNVSAFSGFNIPLGLKNAYPGLKTVSSEQLDTQTIDVLLQRLDISDSRNTQLVIDIPTQIDELLSALLVSEHLYTLNRLVFYKSTTPFISTELTAQEWMERLAEKGFELVNINQSQNTDFMRYEFVQNSLYLSLQQAQSSQIEIQAELAQEQATRQALQADLVVLNTQKSEQLTQLQLQLEQQIAELKQQLQTMQTHNDTNQTCLAAERQKNSELTEAVNSLNLSLKEEQAEKDKLMISIQQARSELDAVNIQKQESDTHNESTLKKLKNQQLELEHTRYTQNLLEAELNKAQAQIEIIKELLIK